MGNNAEQRKAWYLANRDRILAEKRAEYQMKAEFKRAYQRKYRAANAEKVRKADRDRWTASRKDDPDYRRNQREKANAWYQRNREYVLAKSRAMRLLNTYGLTEEAYTAMLVAQGGVCAICRRENDRAAKLAVDHCHQTGIVRGLLCDGCNQAIGRLGDTADSVQRAVSYLAAFEDRVEKASA